MKGVILEKGEASYTDLAKAFAAIQHVQKEYNWLITNFVGYPQDKQIETMLNKEYCWLTGNELTEIIEADNFQWIWAFLSGFEKNTPLHEVLNYDLPYADGYTGFWKNPTTLQHPLASIEIVPWDSALTLVISKNDNIVDNFRKAFPLSENLFDYNERD